MRSVAINIVETTQQIRRIITFKGNGKITKIFYSLYLEGSGRSPTYHCKTTMFTLYKLQWHFLSNVLRYLSSISNTNDTFIYRFNLNVTEKSTNFIKIYSWHFVKTFHLSLIVRILCLLRTYLKDFLLHEINLKILRVQYTPNMI